jgi:flagellar FliJ protein
VKKFRFPLEIVLDYRKQVQDSLQVELGTITAQVKRQEEVCAAARDRYGQINQEFRDKKMEGMMIAEVKSYETALDVQELVIGREAARLQTLTYKMEAKRRELVRAKQDASSVEKLREKNLTAYTKAMEKSEEQFIDDLVCARLGREAASS